MKNKLFNIFTIVLVLSIFAACQPTPAPPVETETPAQTEAPQAVPISEQNAAALTMVLNENVGTGSLSIHWQNDSTAFWLQDLFELTLYAAGSGQLLNTFTQGEYAAIFDISPDGSLIAYALGEDGIHLYDVNTESDKLTIAVDFPYGTAQFSPDGKLLAVPSMLDLKVIFFDAGTGSEAGSSSGFSTAAPVYSAKFSPDGKTLLWFSRGTVQSQDIASQQMGPVLSHEDFVTYQEVSPDGKVIATTAAGMLDDEYTPLLTLWNAATGGQMAQAALPTYFTSISFAPDSTLIAASSEDGINIYSSPYGELIAQYGTPQAVTDVAFSPDGTMLLAASDSGTIYMYAFQ